MNARMTVAPRAARVLVVIPARGGSKGIPRKNVRSLAGRPLLSYAIETALRSRYEPTVVVSSEDPEILALSAQLGASIHRRAPELATDSVTLDPVVQTAVRDVEATLGRSFDIVVTVQPTSPLLTVATLDEVIERLLDRPDLETVLTATEDTHLRWRRRPGEPSRFEPLFTARLNRQELPATYRETGGVVACRRATLERGSRIGEAIDLVLVSGAEAIDIDGREDWALCEWYLTHRDIVFVVAGYPEIGLGHVYNAVAVANGLVRHRVRFLVTKPSQLAYDVLERLNFEVHRQRTDDLVADVLALRPQVVVNDRLDTDATEIRRLKEAGLVVINFEDLGEGAREADLVINAMYPERERVPNHYYGHRYVCLRPEFTLVRPRPISPTVERVTLTFGGTDPCNLTGRVLDAIYPICRERGIAVTVILGLGYSARATLLSRPGVEVVEAVSDMAMRLREADLVFTSAGRTTFEVAAVGTPAIVLAQNHRELTHFFASRTHGFRHLGLGTEVDPATIRRVFLQLIDRPELRRRMQERMLAQDLRSGTERVVRLLERVVNRT